MTKVDEILKWMKEAAENNIPLSPLRWVDAARNLNALIGNETDELYLLEQKVAQAKVALLEAQNWPVSRVNLEVESTDLYREMRQKSARIKMIQEFIRIAKIQARLKDTEMSNYD